MQRPIYYCDSQQRQNQSPHYHTQFRPLFSDTQTKDDLITGYIYVLRSKSDDPFIVANHSIIHKIGVASSDLKKRVANAHKDLTYLLADVEIVTTFKLANINPKKLEALLYKFFDYVSSKSKMQDLFGIPVKPKEWFLVSLEVVESLITKIQEGTLEQFCYDPATASLKRLA